MSRADAIDRGRAAHERKSWRDAYGQLSAADFERPLGAPELELLAESTFLLGGVERSARTLARACASYAARGEFELAARCAVRIARVRLDDDDSLAEKWLGRARAFLDKCLSCAGHGYVLLFDAEHLERIGKRSEASYHASIARRIAERSGDPELLLLTRFSEGRTKVLLGEGADGFAILDDCVDELSKDRLPATTTGALYCRALDFSHEALDLVRTRRWLRLFTEWRAAQPELLAYRAELLVHRVHEMMLRGEWPEAIDELSLAAEWLFVSPRRSVAGSALSQLGELHRLQGNVYEARPFFAKATSLGMDTRLSSARMRFDSGDVQGAATIVRTMLSERGDLLERSRMLADSVPIFIAARDLTAARSSAGELLRADANFRNVMLFAMSTRAVGEVLLSEEKPGAALDALNDALLAWEEIDAPFAVASIHALIGQARWHLSQRDLAKSAFSASRTMFTKIGASGAGRQVDGLYFGHLCEIEFPLSSFELKILLLLASGESNRAISGVLEIRQREVAQCITLILIKMGVASREAAIAYAIKSRLV